MKRILISLMFVLLPVAPLLADAGKTKEAAEIFTLFSDAKQPVGLRRAAFHGLLRLLPDEQRKTTITKWFFEDDREKNDITASYLSELSDRQFDELYKRIGSMSSRNTAVSPATNKRTRC